MKSLAMPHEYRHRLTVAFADTDMAGIVHFSNFFRYMEETEQAFLRSLGVSVHTPTPKGIMSFPRVEAACRFRKPLRFEDEVQIQLFVRERKNKSIAYEFAFHTPSNNEPEPVAIGAITVVCTLRKRSGGPMRAVPIPEELSSRIEAAPPEILPYASEQ